MVRGVLSPGAKTTERIRTGTKVQVQLVLQTAHIPARSVLTRLATTARLAAGGTT